MNSQALIFRSSKLQQSGSEQVADLAGTLRSKLSSNVSGKALAAGSLRYLLATSALTRSPARPKWNFQTVSKPGRNVR